MFTSSQKNTAFRSINAYENRYEMQICILRPEKARFSHPVIARNRCREHAQHAPLMKGRSSGSGILIVSVLPGFPVAFSDTTPPLQRRDRKGFAPFSLLSCAVWPAGTSSFFIKFSFSIILRKQARGNRLFYLLKENIRNSSILSEVLSLCSPVRCTSVRSVFLIVPGLCLPHDSIFTLILFQ